MAPEVTLAILCGGESRRMGAPKASLEIAGRPMLQYVFESLFWPGPTLLVTAPSRQHPRGGELFDREAVDPVEGEGPLRGVHTALQHSKTEYAVICTVDMPALRTEHLNWLVQRLIRRSEFDGMMIRRRAGAEERLEPFPLACRKAAEGAIAALLTSSNRPVHSVLELPGFAAEDAPSNWSSEIWTNLNTPQDYKAFVKLAR